MKSRFVWLPAAALLAAQLMACGDGTGPTQGPPTLTLVNGVSKPTGLVGMTILIEGTNLGDAAHGKVLFTPAGGGTPVEATIANPTGDWTNSFVVTILPQGVPDNAQITNPTA